MIRYALLILLAIGSSGAAADLTHTSRPKPHAAARRAALPDTAALVAVDGFAGACQALTIAGQDRTADCLGKLIATRSADGRAGFYFILRDGSTVAFSAPAWRGPAADEVELPVDNLLSGPIIETAPTPAHGSCDVTDLASAPVWVRCEASQEDGRFSATFLSDRSAPVDLRGAPQDEP